LFNYDLLRVLTLFTPIISPCCFWIIDYVGCRKLSY